MSLTVRSSSGEVDRDQLIALANPLLKTQRRRGDANVAWDMRPLDASAIKTALKSVAEFFPG